MDEPITVREVESNEDIAEFWRYRDEYITRDIFPNDTLGKPLTKEDLDWFLSKEYKDLMMKLFHRDEDKVRFVFFERDGKNWVLLLCDLFFRGQEVLYSRLLRIT